MDRASMDKLVNDHFMYEATADLEGVISTYTDDPEHHVVGGPDGPLRGKAAIRGFYVGLFRDLKGERAEPVMRLYGDDFIVDETVLVGQVVDGRPFRLAGRKGPIRLRLLHVFRLRDGRIAKEKVWFDFDDVSRQLGGGESKRAGRALPPAAKPRRVARAPAASRGGRKTLRKQRGR